VRSRDERVVRVFGEEWARFPQSALSQADLDAMYADFFAVFPWERIDASAVGADFGCGSGRWAKYVAPRVRHLHLIDASAAALDVARANLREAGNVSFHQSVLHEITLPERSLDFGYALGVLHHIPDTTGALASVVRTLKPGAPLLVYLYYAFDNRPVWFRSLWPIADLGRRIICRLPKRLRYVACDCIALTVYWPLARAARALDRSGRMPAAWPLSWYRNRSFYVMRTDALDRFGTSLEKRFRREQIETMLHDAGLTDVRFSPEPPYWCAVAIKAHGRLPAAHQQRTVQSRRRVLILCTYPLGVAAGQRFRFEQYLRILGSAGIDTTVSPFLPSWVWPVLYKPGNTMRKVWAVLGGVVRRLALLFYASRYDYIFIHLEAAPVGPPILEWLLFSLGCKVIYDIDDAIFISRTSSANRLAAWLRWRSKVRYIARNSWCVTACNPFLVNWATEVNNRVVRLPTTVDPSYHIRTRRRTPGARPVIGWTGSRSNLSYLDLVVPALMKLQETHEFTFRVICDVSPSYTILEHFEFVPWRLETEIEDLQHLDIGLMPVPDGLWEKGKVGFKAIQYSALETVPVASAVGSGAEVVIDGKTGFLVKNEEADWLRVLTWLLDNPDSWNGFGAAARQHILANYSVPSLAQNYISLFE